MKMQARKFTFFFLTKSKVDLFDNRLGFDGSDPVLQNRNRIVSDPGYSDSCTTLAVKLLTKKKESTFNGHLTNISRLLLNIIFAYARVEGFIQDTGNDCIFGKSFKGIEEDVSALF